LVVSEPNAGPSVIVCSPLNLAIHPLVPVPVILSVIDGVTVTVYAVPPEGVTVNPLVPPVKVYVVSVNLGELPTACPLMLVI